MATSNGIFNYCGLAVRIDTHIQSDRLILMSRDTGQETLVDRPVTVYTAAQDFEDSSVIVAGLVGSGNGTAKLQRYFRSASGVHLAADNYQWAGGRVESMAFRPGMPGTLYVLDSASKEIRQAQYSPGSQIPTNWTVLANQVTLPLLALPDLRDYQIVYYADADRILVQSIAHSPMAWLNPISGPAENRDSFVGWPGIRDTGIDMVAGETSVGIEPTAASVQIVCFVTDSDWTVIGTSPTGSSPVAVPPLLIGDLLAAKRADLPFPTPPWIPVVRRDGAAQPLNAASTIRPLSRGLGWAHVGDDTFAVSLHVDHTDPRNVVVPASYSSLCSVGSPQDIVTINGVAVLDSPNLVPASIDVWKQSTSGFGSVDLPIPADQGLSGLEFSFQYWVDNGTELRVSDIVTVVMRPSSFGGPDPLTMMLPGGQISQATGPGKSALVTRRDWSSVSRVRIFASLLRRVKLLDAVQADAVRARLRRELLARR
ncbi:MAG: hypothetical protein H6836_09315 [Planctomycetes bacterium]|nr:hypothetical protein [Planctomycetota bacterium]